MLRIERIGKRLVSFANLKTRSLEEFYELGDFIANSPEQFFGEVGESLLLVANGMRTAEDAESYVDALAVDRNGAAVVVIITLSDSKSPLTRAINSASRVAGWERDELLRRIGPGMSRELRGYLGENFRNLNKQQRVLLIAENFSQELLSTAAWLSGSYGVDIACMEVTLAYDSVSGGEFLNCRLAMGRPSVEPAAGPSDEEPLKPQATEATVPEPLPEAPEPLFEELPVEEPTDLFDQLLPGTGGMPFDLFGSAENGHEAEPAHSPEMRAVPRRTQFTSPGMAVQYAGRDMSAGLVDYTQQGVGLTMHSPLPVGMSVVVKGSLAWSDTKVELEKRGRVVHCNFLGQAFRLGILFTPVVAAQSGN
jgi:hypothetical protein